MDVVAKLDDYGKPAWITAMVLGFVVFWPVGLVILAYLIGSGRMGCWKHKAPGRWQFERGARGPGAGRADRSRRRRRESASGNSAFDEYRDETLRRLEDEQQEFHGFLERLRQARDKAEFDRFMAERGAGSGDAEAPDGPDLPGAPDEPAPQPAA